MRGRLDAGELHGFPALGAVGGRDEVENRAALLGVAGVPFGADGEFAFAVAVEVLRGEADVVFFGEVFGDEVFAPRGGVARLGGAGVAIPDDLPLVGEEHVGRFVAIHIGDDEAVADLDFVVEGDGGELRLRRLGGEGEGTEDEKKCGCFHGGFFCGVDTPLAER